MEFLVITRMERRYCDDMDALSDNFESCSVVNREVILASEISHQECPKKLSAQSSRTIERGARIASRVFQCIQNQDIFGAVQTVTSLLAGDSDEFDDDTFDGCPRIRSQTVSGTSTSSSSASAPKKKRRKVTFMESAKRMENLKAVLDSINLMVADLKQDEDESTGFNFPLFLFSRHRPIAQKRSKVMRQALNLKNELLDLIQMINTLNEANESEVPAAPPPPPPPTMTLVKSENTSVSLIEKPRPAAAAVARQMTRTKTMPPTAFASKSRLGDDMKPPPMPTATSNNNHMRRQSISEAVKMHTCPTGILKRTNSRRSPGGTPMRSFSPGGLHPRQKEGDQLVNALQRRFKAMQTDA